jgi:RNA-directed DNA polymerase
LHKKNFQNVFNAYFHQKYTFDEFLQTTPQKNIHYKLNKFKTYSFVSYIKKNHCLSDDSLKLKNYHTFLKNTLFNYMKVHHNVYSYQHDKNIYDLAKQHHMNHNFFKTDIQGFFKHINPSLILNILETNLDSFLFSHDVKNYFENIVKLVTIDDFLPVGYVTSPSISNAVLYNFDSLLSNYCETHHITYTRYSDDLIFSSNEYKVLKMLPQKITEIFEALYVKQFQLNKDKTLFFDKTNKVTFLGINILPNGHITVDKYMRENMRQLFYFYINDKSKFYQFLEKRYNGSLSKAYGTLNYINDIDKDFVTKLRKKYGTNYVDMFLHGAKN